MTPVMAHKTDISTKVSRLREFVLREKRMPGYNEMLTIDQDVTLVAHGGMVTIGE